MSEEQQIAWNHVADVVIGSILALAIAVGGYYVNQMDQRDAEQDKRITDHQVKSEVADREHEQVLAEHAHRITSSEKEIEFANRKFVQIDSKLDELLKEVRNLRESR